jgi:flagellar biosynthesis/type III secretory pathway protein FliH
VDPYGEGPPALSPRQLRRIPAEVAEAREQAQAELALARAEASLIVERARVAAVTVAENAAREARAEEEAKLSALYLRLKHEDEVRAERDLDRAITLAVVLAERILGEVVEQDPTKIAALARQALREARGVRTATIDVCPLDAEVLEAHVAEVGLSSGAVQIRVDPTLTRGSLHLSTNLGSLDARLRPQLERLARALRDTLPRS